MERKGFGHVAVRSARKRNSRLFADDKKVGMEAEAEGEAGSVATEGAQYGLLALAQLEQQRRRRVEVA